MRTYAASVQDGVGAVHVGFIKKPEQLQTVLAVNFQFSLTPLKQLQGIGELITPLAHKLV